MRRGGWKALRIVRLFLLAAFCLVHCPGALSPALSQAAKPKSGSAKKQQASLTPQVRYGTEGLPAPVQEMREAILTAVRAGRIEELRHAWELNELKPDLGANVGSDPIAHWKQISGDGEGREILAAIGELLDAGYVTLPLGPDIENNGLYVWPYFAEMPIDKLTPPQEVELLRLVPPAAVRAMRAAGRYTYWRLAIGADGTWHSFRRDP